MKNDPRRRELANYHWSAAMETRFADMDVNGHLNNVAIARFFEETRIRFNWALFAGALEGRPRFLVGHVAVDYLAEGRYPAPVTMAYALAEIGRSSFRSAKAMFQDGRCIALCDTVLVHRGESGAAPLPEALRERLEPLLLKG
ncbi:hypothetical protein IP88_12700 [alpha proteobacterium AAP81b]|nr:hypothetical protein IP88_12700 [alpha proteobacterium AAP81b]